MVAVTILIGAFAGASQILASGFAGIAEARARDNATQIVAQEIERARAFGCGLTIGVEPDASRAARQSECAPGGVPSVPGGGDMTFTQTENGVQFNVNVRHRFIRFDGNAFRLTPSACQYTTSSTPPTTHLWQPDALLRTVTVTYTVNNRTKVERSEFVESIPPDQLDFNSSDRGSMFVRVMQGSTPRAGQIVRLLAVKPTVTYPAGLPAGHQTYPSVIERRTDESGCAWFPYLPANHYVFVGVVGASSPVGPAVVVRGEGRTITAMVNNPVAP